LSVADRLRRDLGTLESYAGLLGMLIGAGIFRVTSDAWARTGPSIILGQLLLAGVVLATLVPYAAFVSSPLGRLPGGEYLHLQRTLGWRALPFVGAWLKIISYLGAIAFLARVQADYLSALLGQLGGPSLMAHRVALAFAGLTFFFVIHVIGVRWFGRVQVALCAVLGLSLLVLVVPGLFHLRSANYLPFFTHGASGFFASLPLLFFSFAGFEAMVHGAGEVRDSTRRLPRIFLRGIGVSTLIYLLMSIVSMGVLPGPELATSDAPMARVASVYLPAGAAALVTLGATFAVSTALNGSMLVPSRLLLMLAEDGLAPAWMGRLSSRFGTPVISLGLSYAIAATILLSGQVSLALNIAVFALTLLYFVHTVAFLLVPWTAPSLHASMELRLSRPAHLAVSLLALVSLGGLIVVQVIGDVRMLRTTSLASRYHHHALTSVELALAWIAIGALLFVARRRHQRGRAQAAASPDPRVAAQEGR
jgi:amino acid transporter